MKWNHLPVAGGLYDQHPELLDKFAYIFAKQAEVDERKRQEEEAKREAERRKTQNKGPGGSRSPSRRRR